MLPINQSFTVSYNYKVHFVRSVFDSVNPLFAEVVQPARHSSPVKILVVLDEGLFNHHPQLFSDISLYAKSYPGKIELIHEPVIIPGGEASKNSPEWVHSILEKINSEKIDRHSFIVAIGGGAVIDAAGYAAGIAHRGIRLIRVPTTVLAQNDASVGVKNGINAFGKKNFLGTFVPPFAVINDFDFLSTLDRRDRIAGISEAIKVALLTDEKFFRFIDEHADALAAGDDRPMEKLIYECARLHLEHISGSGDPFETGSSRPLDFGHWSAHKLEQLTDYKLRHGEAVAIGLALDVTYSFLSGTLSEKDWKQILEVLKSCGFRLFDPGLRSHLDDPAHPQSLLHGLQEFREHLGGKLTIMLLRGIGKGMEVNQVDISLYRKAIGMLEELENEPVNEPHR
jgi:3-dehydroquinate synthase